MVQDNDFFKLWDQMLSTAAGSPFLTIIKLLLYVNAYLPLKY